MSDCTFLRPSVRMERFGSHWTKFREYLHWKLLFTSVENVQVWLQSEKKYQTLQMKTSVRL
jgi:hypothetical protein